MKARYLTFLGLFATALAGLTSCTDAIFATVETATKTATNNLSLTLNIYDVAVTSPGAYSVAAGGVFNGMLNGSYPGTVAWTPNVNDSSRPNNPSGNSCNALAFFSVSGLVYGGFLTSSGSPSFWKSDGTYSFGSGHGTMIPTLLPGQQVTMLRAAGVAPTYLFMGRATANSRGFTYELDYSPDGTTWSVVPGVQNLTDPITGVGYDNVHHVFWAASSAIGIPGTSINRPTYLYTGGTPAGLALTANPVPLGDQINSLYTDTLNGRTFLATRANGVYWTPDGVTWNNMSPDHVNGNTPVSYLCVAGPVDNPLSAGGVAYVAGSDGFGYYSFTIGGGLSRYGNTTIILFTSSVSRITVDAGGIQTNVLMGTNANGLWRGVFDTTGNLASGQSWVQE